MNSTQAKKIPLTRILDRLGYQPVRQERGRDGTTELRYSSPFREEKDPSFNVNIEKNLWNDFGDRGGNILDFIMEYYNISDFPSALRQLEDLIGQQRAEPLEPVTVTKLTDQSLEVRGIQSLRNQALIQYLSGTKEYVHKGQRLHERGISIVTARPYVKEIYYTRKGNPYFALAFENDSGGYEFRNRYFKGTHGSKDITLIEKKELLAKKEGGKVGKAVTVFEGFIDFLSALEYYQKPITTPVIVMNSATMKDRAVEAIKEMEVDKVYLYLDRDRPGRKLTEYLESQLDGLMIVDNSGLYAGYEDFNDFLVARKQQHLSLFHQ